MLTQEQVQELIEQAKPSIIDSFKKQMAESISWDMREAVRKAVGEHAMEWLRAEVLPEITKQLVENKASLIALGANLGPATVEAVTASLLSHLKNQLEQSHSRSKIFEALFGRGY